MYFATQDKVIDQRHKEVERENNRIIEEFNNLPFYKKWFAPDVKQQIIENWEAFGRWQNRRMNQQMLRDKDYFFNL